MTNKEPTALRPLDPCRCQEHRHAHSAAPVTPNRRDSLGSHARYRSALEVQSQTGISRDDTGAFQGARYASLVLPHIRISASLSAGATIRGLPAGVTDAVRERLTFCSRYAERRVVFDTVCSDAMRSGLRLFSMVRHVIPPPRGAGRGTWSAWDADITQEAAEYMVVECREAGCRLPPAWPSSLRDAALCIIGLTRGTPREYPVWPDRPEPTFQYAVPFERALPPGNLTCAFGVCCEHLSPDGRRYPTGAPECGG